MCKESIQSVTTWLFMAPKCRQLVCLWCEAMEWNRIDQKTLRKKSTTINWWKSADSSVSFDQIFTPCNSSILTSIEHQFTFLYDLPFQMWFVNINKKNALEMNCAVWRWWNVVEFASAVEEECLISSWSSVCLKVHSQVVDTSITGQCNV